MICGLRIFADGHPGEYMLQEKIMTIPTEEVYETSEPYMAAICGYEREGTSAQKTKKKAMQVRESLFDGTSMDILYAPFSPDCVRPDGFLIDGVQIECSKLSGIPAESILSGYVFMFHAPMPDLSSFPVSRMYLADSWQTSFVDAGRNFIRRKFHELAGTELSREIYITDTIAPGMCGMPAAKVKSFFELLDGSKIDIELLESGMMNPVKSFTGIFLILDRESVIQTSDCSQCLSGHTNCEYCKNYAERYME